MTNYIIEERHGQWILRKVSTTLSIMRDGVQVPMGEVIYQGTKTECKREQRKDQAISTMIHAMYYIDRCCEFSPSNGMARRIIENLILDMSA